MPGKHEEFPGANLTLARKVESHCKECRFANQINRDLPSGPRLECRFNPPAWPRPDYQGVGLAFPLVHEHMWCGRFEPLQYSNPKDDPLNRREAPE